MVGRGRLVVGVGHDVAAADGVLALLTNPLSSLPTSIAPNISYIVDGAIRNIGWQALSGVDVKMDYTYLTDGWGRISAMTAELLRPWGVRILVHSRRENPGHLPDHVTLTPLDRLMRESDVVCVLAGAQAMRGTAGRMGVQLPPGVSPGLKNAAAVMITAQLPAFAKPGQRIDVTVSTIGKAKSLRGGALVGADIAATEAVNGLLGIADHDEAVALGVVEERPFTVMLDFHAPSQFRVVGAGIDEPGMRIVSAVDLARRGDVACRIDHSVSSHSGRLPQPMLLQSSTATTAYQPVPSPWTLRR